jgi:hypothetical protein
MLKTITCAGFGIFTILHNAVQPDRREGVKPPNDFLSVDHEFSRRPNELAVEIASHCSNKPTFDAIILGDEYLRDFAIFENGGTLRFMRGQHRFPF